MSAFAESSRAFSAEQFEALAREARFPGAETLLRTFRVGAG